MTQPLVEAAGVQPQRVVPTAPLIVVDRFLPPELALELRRDIESHFAHPEEHRPETHQVWNYWFVAESYESVT